MKPPLFLHSNFTLYFSVYLSQEWTLLQALLVNKHGQARLVDGPQRVFVFNKRFQCLTRFSADQKQYLKIQHRDGTIEHMPGWVRPIAG